MMKRKIYIVLAVIAIVALLTGYIVFLLDIRTGQGLKTLVAENDSLESANWNLKSYIQYRLDSIATEDSLRFGVTALIKDELNIDERANFQDGGKLLNVYHKFRDSWVDSLKNKKFELKETVLLEEDCYDEEHSGVERWDIYGKTYSREVYGRQISIILHYNKLKRTNDGEIIPEDNQKLIYDNIFDIKFSSTEDYDYFLQTLRKHNYIKKYLGRVDINGNLIYTYITNYESKDPSDRVRLCDDPVFSIRDSLWINVQFMDCQD